MTHILYVFRFEKKLNGFCYHKPVHFRADDHLDHGPQRVGDGALANAFEPIGPMLQRLVHRNVQVVVGLVGGQVDLEPFVFFLLYLCQIFFY